MADSSEWSGALGAKWAEWADVMEDLLGPFGDAAMAALGDITGKRILDLGCGGGASTFALAEKGADPLGVDISPHLIALAEKRREGMTGPARLVDFRCIDAATATFKKPFKGLFSQFGAMFFPEEEAAYSHLRSLMKKGSPLAIACWRTPRENEWATLGLNAAKPHLPPQPPADRRAPGPFAWSEPEESFAPVLEAAGWKDVAWQKLDHQLELGATVEGDRVEAAVQFAMNIGPLPGRIRDEPEEVQKKVEEAVRAAMSAHSGGGPVMAACAGWLVTARA